MEKIETFIKDYDCTRYPSLPKFIKRRLDALKKIQLEHIDIQYQYHQKLQELEFEFEKKFQPLYEKRTKIINGEYEPSDEECQLPANIAEDEFNGDQENSQLNSAPLLSEAEENSLKEKVKGVPGFWLGCLVSTYNFSDSIEDHDRKVLRYLDDIRLSYSPLTDGILTYKLEFIFSENPYFSNNVLTKVYHLKLKPDEKSPFTYEGFEVFKSEGCEIKWKAGKDVTKKTKTVKQKNKINGQTREKKKEVEQDSFFYFFKAPKFPEENEEIDDELGTMISVDFELGEIIRQSIIPKAPLYYIGYLMEEEDDDSEDEDDDDDEGPYGMDDSDENSDDDDDDDDSEDYSGAESSGEADSLNETDKAKATKK